MRKKIRTVLDLKSGEEGVIEKFNGKSLTCNLMTLGVMPEARVKMIRQSPLGSAVCLKFGDYHLAIRKTQASKIIIA